MLHAGVLSWQNDHKEIFVCQRKKNACGWGKCFGRCHAAQRQDGIVHRRRALMNGGHKCEQEGSLSSHWWIQEPMCQRPAEDARPRTVMCSDNRVKLLPPLIYGGALRFIFRQILGPLSSGGGTVYNCDNDGKQLAQESFSMTSTPSNRNLWINMSGVLRHGLLGPFPRAGHLLSAPLMRFAWQMHEDRDAKLDTLICGKLIAAARFP